MENKWQAEQRFGSRQDAENSAGNVAQLLDQLFHCIDSGLWQAMAAKLAALPEESIKRSLPLMVCRGSWLTYQEDALAQPQLLHALHCAQEQGAAQWGALALAELSYAAYQHANFEAAVGYLQGLSFSNFDLRTQAHLYQRRAIAHYGVDCYPAALLDVEAAIALRQQLGQANDQAALVALLRLQALILATAGSPPRSALVLKEAYALARSLSSSPFTLAWILNNLAAQYRAMGQFQHAHLALDEAESLLIKEREVVENHRLYYYLELNRVHLRCDDYEDEFMLAWVQTHLAQVHGPTQVWWEEGLYDFCFSHVAWHQTGLEWAHKRWLRDQNTTSPNDHTLIRSMVGLGYLVNGNPHIAKEHLCAGLDAWRQHDPETIGTNQLCALVYLAEAYFRLQQSSEALATLKLVIIAMRQQGYYNVEIWVPSLLAHLCYQALVHEIEPEYVEALVVKRFRTRYHEPFLKLLLHENPQIRQRGERIVRHFSQPDLQKAYSLLQSCKEPSTQQRLLTWLAEGWLTPFGLLYLRQFFSWRELETFLLWIHPAYQAETETIARAMQISPDTVKSYLKSIKGILRQHFALPVEGRGAQMPAFAWAIKQSVVDAMK